MDKTEVQNIIAFAKEALRDPSNCKSFFQRRRSLQRSQLPSDRPNVERKIGLIGEEIRIAEELQKRRASEEARQINALIRSTQIEVRSGHNAVGLGLSILRDSLRDSGRQSLLMTQIEDLKERRQHERRCDCGTMRLPVPPTDTADDELSDESSNGDFEDCLEQLESSRPGDETPMRTLTNESKHHLCPDGSLPPHFSAEKYLALMDKLDSFTLMCEDLKRENHSLRKKLRSLSC